MGGGPGSSSLCQELDPAAGCADRGVRWVSPGLGCSRAAGDAPFAHPRVQDLPWIVPTAPRVHSMGKLAGGKDDPQAGGESTICPGGPVRCVASITGACKMLQPPLSHVPCPMSHVPQPAGISPQYPSRYPDTHRLWLRPASPPNPPWVQMLHGFCGEVFLIDNIIFPADLLKRRGARPGCQQGAIAWGTVLRGRIRDSRDVPALRLPSGRK